MNSPERNTSQEHPSISHESDSPEISEDQARALLGDETFDSLMEEATAKVFDTHGIGDEEPGGDQTRHLLDQRDRETARHIVLKTMGATLAAVAAGGSVAVIHHQRKKK
jgi:hypothetical protein